MNKIYKNMRNDILKVFTTSISRYHFFSVLPIKIPQ